MRIFAQEAAETAQTLLPGVSPELQANIVLSVLVVLLVFVARRAVLAVANRRVKDSTARYRWAKVTANVAFVLVVLLLAPV